MNYLFSKWKSIKEKLKNKQLLLFLDYDGTLTPIVECPEKAVIPLKNKELLKKLSKLSTCKLAVISGRALKDVKNKVGIRGIIYAGNHGLEVEAHGINFESQIPQYFKSILRRIKGKLRKELLLIKGVFIEDKNLTLSIHYRIAAPGSQALVKKIVNEVVQPYLAGKQLKLNSGKKVIEIKPSVKWDKGKVILWLLSKKQFISAREKVLPVYIGDDITDEDAFKALKNKGFTIFVGKPKDSHARYYLKNSGEVTVFLEQILEMLND